MKCLVNLEKRVRRFYFYLWLKWALYVTFSSLVFAVLVAAFSTLFIYCNQGCVTLTPKVYMALFKIFQFWFALAWSVTLLLSLFLSLKHIFNRCYAHFQLILFTCPDENKQREKIEKIGYGDLVKVWRKWFMLLIWLVGAQMVIAFIFMKLFGSSLSLFEWFNIYLLYLFVLIGGYFSFIILSAKCKKVKVVKC